MRAMGLIASRLLFALSVIAAHSAPLLAAESLSASNATETEMPRLPSFVPPARQANYATAVRQTNSAAGTRRAAEELSSKFADVTTSSITREEPQPKIASQSAQPAVETEDARSIVLAASHPDDPKLATDGPPPPSRPKRVAKSGIKLAARSEERPPTGGTAENLASIGKKVSFFDLLTNPALWH
jgi:hypothetical protein